MSGYLSNVIGRDAFRSAQSRDNDDGVQTHYGYRMAKMEREKEHSQTRHAESRPRCIAAALALVGWCAMGTEFHFLLGGDRPAHLVHTALQFLSFFTVNSNLLVAFILTSWALRPATWRTGTLAASVAAAGVVYILMTGLVYTLFLRQSHSDALGWAVDVALHQLIPVGYCAFWVRFIPKRRLGWSHAFGWLIFPLVFAAASIVRGAITHESTYAFLDADRIGYGRVAFMVVLLSLPFLGLGSLVIKFNRALEGSDGKRGN